MKDWLSDAIREKVSATLESTGGMRAVYGDPVSLNGEEIVPVGRVTITLGADATGSGGGDSGVGAGGKLSSMAKGSGGGDAAASVRIDVEPVGFVRSTANGPEFQAIE